MNIDNTRWDNLQLLRAQLKAYFKQREEVVDGALAALLAGVHVLLVGPPGTAKSMLTHVLCTKIEGASYFYYLLNKFTTWAQLACGPAIVREQDDESGKTIHFRNTEGPMLRALIVFLDEIFKASGATLNSLLSYLNERTYSINAGELGRAPVLTVFAASNELPGKDEEELRAFADRFLLRYEVQYISISHEGDTAFIDMLAGDDPVPDCRLDIDEFRFFRAQAERVAIRRSVLGMVSAIRAKLKLAHQIEPSDRRYKESLRVLKAFAFLNGHAEVTIEDLGVLEHVLWTSRDRSERDAVRKVIHEVVRDPALLQAVALFGEAERIYRDAVDCLKRAAGAVPFDQGQRQALEVVLDQARGHERRLEEIYLMLDGLAGAAESGTATTLRTYVNQVSVFRKHLVQTRGVENPFLLLPPGAGQTLSAEGASRWAQA